MADDVLPSRLLPGPPGRMRFYVELKPNETNYVSWKKLLKDSQKASSLQDTGPSSAERPVGAHPALEARIAPEVAVLDPIAQKDTTSGHQRFNAVIERIERLYKGNNSEEEDIGAFPDDNEYDTEDSFIDDSELNEYFSVDEAKTKHTGFFINRGTLEQINESPQVPVHAPKKRRRKETKRMEHNVEIPKKSLKTGPVRLKAAARNASLVARTAVESSDDRNPVAVAHVLDKNPIKRQEPNSLTVHVGSAGLNQKKSSELCSKAKQNSVSISEQNLDVQQNSTPNHDDYMKELLTDSSNDMKTLDRIRAMDSTDGNNDANITEVSANKILTPKGKLLQPGYKESGSSRPKCTTLEKAFQDLEKGVAEYCPPSMDFGDSDQASQDVRKRRLPRDVKQKLAKVARLAAKQGKISEEVIGRLMGILGHIMRIKTLKRNLKAMVDLGISAKREKEGRLQHMKKEFTEMVQMQVSSLQAQVREVGHQDHSAGDVHGVSTSGEKWNGSFKWDIATEDLLYDFYDQYVEGMDEHRGPQIKKLYSELAELWPEGMMNKAGIKDALNRAKERKKQLTKYNNSGGEPRRKRKPSAKSNATELRNGESHLTLSFNHNEPMQHMKQTFASSHSEAVNERSQLHVSLEQRVSTLDNIQKCIEKDENRDLWNSKHCFQQDEILINRKRKPKMEIGDETNAASIKNNASYKKEMQVEKEELHRRTGDITNSIQLNGHLKPEVVQID